MEQTIQIDDQPISAGFYGEGKWLSNYITPDEPDILTLWKEITQGIESQQDRIVAAWDWVANQVRYKPFISATISVEGKVSRQDDFWQTPAMCSRTHVGNCANKAFLLTSLLRNEFGPESVYTVLGNLYNGHPAGHAWVEVVVGGQEYIVEATRNDVPMSIATLTDRYEPVHYFNDSKVLAVPGRTVLTPFQACFSSWLKDYLDWNYIQNGGH
jgi:transglutaminase-like putative cysteine protease